MAIMYNGDDSSRLMVLDLEELYLFTHSSDPVALVKRAFSWIPLDFGMGYYSESLGLNDDLQSPRKKLPSKTAQLII